MASRMAGTSSLPPAEGHVAGLPLQHGSLSAHEHQDALPPQALQQCMHIHLGGALHLSSAPCALSRGLSERATAATRCKTADLVVSHNVALHHKQAPPPALAKVDVLDKHSRCDLEVERLISSAFTARLQLTAALGAPCPEVWEEPSALGPVSCAET